MKSPHPFTACALFAAACSTPAALDRGRAAEKAAQAANNECERVYGRRPFISADFEPEWTESRWSWGRLDPLSRTGYSAEVSFRNDGGDCRVLVFFCCDSSSTTEKFNFVPQDLESLPGSGTGTEFKLNLKLDPQLLKIPPSGAAPEPASPPK